LVGDAGCHKDPFLALGICDALRDAELLANSLDDGLAGRRPMEDAMASYERARDAATLPDYERNLHMARFEPAPPELMALRAALRDNQPDTDRFFLASQGLLPRESFFNNENLARVLGGGTDTEDAALAVDGAAS
ncbi:MAG: hypothetical protein ACRELX_04325, partial [Longimicrobiales bacterium]